MNSNMIYRLVGRAAIVDFWLIEFILAAMLLTSGLLLLLPPNPDIAFFVGIIGVRYVVSTLLFILGITEFFGLFCKKLSIRKTAMFFSTLLFLFLGISSILSLGILSTVWTMRIFVSLISLVCYISLTVRGFIWKRG